MKKFLMLMILFFSIFVINNKVSATEELFIKNAKSGILIESKTGKILYEKNKNERLPMASMTKVMTLSIIMDAIKSNKLDYLKKIQTSENAKNMGGSQVYLETNEVHTLDELLKCICVSSANDAAVTVAEALCGSEEKFVSLMNEKAKTLGLSDTHFTDCTGLSNENHYTSAHNMAIMSSYLLNNYPEIIKYTSIKEDYIRQDTKNPFWLVNTNKLIGHNNIDGLKTGWTEKAGYCISATSMVNNMRLICVVMGYSNSKDRNKEVVELLNYGYSNYELKCIISKGDVIKNISDIKFSPRNFKLVASEDIYIVKEIDSNVDNIKVKYSYEIEESNILNNDVGNVEIYENDNLLCKTNIVLSQTVKRRKFFSILIEILKELFI